MLSPLAGSGQGPQDLHGGEAQRVRDLQIRVRASLTVLLHEVHIFV